MLLNILGDGEWRLYKQKVVDLNIVDKIYYCGYVSNDKIEEYYKKAYLFIVPAKHESFRLTVAEAMALGLPVISTTRTAIPELVQHGITGKEMGNLIIQTLKSEELLR